MKIKNMSEKEYNRKYYEKNKEKIKEKRKENYQKNKEKIKEKMKDPEYRRKKQEAQKLFHQKREGYFRDYYQKNKEKLKEKALEYQRLNPVSGETKRLYSSKYYAKKRIEILAKMKEKRAQKLAMISEGLEK